MSCELQGTDKLIFRDKYPSIFSELNGGYGGYNLSNIFPTGSVLEIEEYHSDISQF